MITVIDYKMGNLGSVLNMLKKVGAAAQVSSDPDVILKAEKLILPGVGHFGSAMENLKSMNLLPVLLEKTKKNPVPTLGVCMGMQLLSLTSEEGSSEGLGLLPTEVKKFSFENGDLRVPHMGWNYINIKKKHPVLEGLDDESRFYFVHSYYVVAKDPSCVLTETEYGLPFVSGMAQDLLVGFQFHPEKSHRFGMQIYKNFAEWKP